MSADQHYHQMGASCCPHPDCVKGFTRPSPAITADDMDSLRHTLGVDYDRKRKHWGYRNHFVTSKTDPSMLRLVACGFMVDARGRNFLDDRGETTFRATFEGCLAVGMRPEDIAKMEPPPPKNAETRP